MNQLLSKKIFLILFVIVFVGFNSCEEDPIDTALKNALDFEGVFVTDGGSEVTLQPNGDIIFTKEGTDWPITFSYFTPPIELAFGFNKVLGNNTWGSGYARLNGGFGSSINYNLI